MCAAIEYCQAIEEGGQYDAWDLARKISGMSHILRMQVFHEYEMKKIMEKYSYLQAKDKLAEFHML